MLRLYYHFSSAFHAITFSCKPQPYRSGITIAISKQLKCPLQDQRAAIPVVALKCKAMYSEGLAFFPRYPRSSPPHSFSATTLLTEPLFQSTQISSLTIYITNVDKGRKGI